MKQRCHNPNAANYHLYGARGIYVCERWRNSFKNFFADMGDRPEGHSLDRVDNYKGYNKGNCRWVLARHQHWNKRKTIFIKIGADRRCIQDWASTCGVAVKTIYNRIRRGWDPVKAVTTPTRGSTQNKRMVTYRGETKNIWQWAKSANIPYKRLLSRVDAGWDFQLALTHPKQKGGRPGPVKEQFFL